MRRLSLDWDSFLFCMVVLSWSVSSAQFILQLFSKAKWAFPDMGVVLSPPSAAFWRAWLRCSQARFLPLTLFFCWWQDLQRDIEQHTAGVESVFNICEVLLHDSDACANETECDSIQQTTRSLDRRWRNICAMSMERRMKYVSYSYPTETCGSILRKCCSFCHKLNFESRVDGLW